MRPEEIYILVGCEESQAVTIAFRNLGFQAFSCDLKPCSGGHPEWHIQGDIFRAIYSRNWHAGIFFPDCTYLTCSAEWAYKDGPYHQKTKPGTLTGEKRRMARNEAMHFFLALWSMDKDLKNPIKNIAIENPVGFISKFQKPNQIIQPWYFGDDANKKTCLWLKGFPVLNHKKENYFNPRIIEKDGKFIYRWGNQTDSGQNNVSPCDNRAELRSKTFSGIAAAMASQWGEYLLKTL